MTVSLTGFSRYREMASEFSRAGKCGFYPDLGGTADLFIVRPKLMYGWLRAFLCSKTKNGGIFYET